MNLKEKQIEEMGKAMCEEFRSEHCGNDCECANEFIAKKLVEQGYRKLPKDSVILERELYNEMVDDVKVSKEKIARIIDSAKAKGSKETAQNIFNQIIWYATKRIGKTTNDTYYQISLERLQEILKQFGIETK